MDFIKRLKDTFILLDVILILNCVSAYGNWDVLSPDGNLSTFIQGYIYIYIYIEREREREGEREK